jgi:DNA-3-methyladenine glycosylase
MTRRIRNDFFAGDVLLVAPALLGMKLFCRDHTGLARSFTITETEAYRGTEDLACHASRGRTARTDPMYMKGGVLYVYLIYGMHWMLNIVTGKAGDPQAVLIRGLEGITGPGRITKALGIDGSFNRECISGSPRIWLEPGDMPLNYLTTPRIGIEYAGPVWKLKPWRFVAAGSPSLKP